MLLLKKKKERASNHLSLQQDIIFLQYPHQKSLIAGHNNKNTSNEQLGNSVIISKT